MHVDTVVCGVAILVETRRWWWWWHAAALGSCGVSEVSDEHKMFVSTTTAKIVRADGDGLTVMDYHCFKLTGEYEWLGNPAVCCGSTEEKSWLR